MSTQRAFLPGIALALAVGCALGGLTGSIPLPRMAFLGSAPLLTFMALWRRSVVLLWLSFLVAGVLLGAPETIDKSPRLVFLREVKGEVASPPEPHPKTISFVLDLPHLGTRLMAYVPKDVDLRPGDTVRVQGRFERPGGGWGEYLERRGIAGVFWGKELEILERGTPGLMGLFYSLRSHLTGILTRSFPEDAAPLVVALLLGVRGELPFEVKEGFRRAGVAHLLALSGLHLGIIAYGLWKLLGVFRIQPGRRYAILFAVVGIYVGLSGGRISLVRAGLMFGAWGIFWILWERGLVLRDWYDPLQALSAAAIVVLSIWPWSALDLGFELSFAAAGAIVWGWPHWRDHPLRERIPKTIGSVADLLWISLCAQLGTVGLVGSSFGYISPYAILSNLVLIPWTALIIWTGLLVLALYPLGAAPFLGEIAGKYFVIPYLEMVSRISSLPGAHLPVGRHFGLWYLFAALVIISLRSSRSERLQCG